MLKIAFFNGPPRAGKDTIGRGVGKLHNAWIAKFARSLKDGVHAMHGLGVDAEYFDEVKDKPRDEFFGKTPREAYIAGSEIYMKWFHNNNEIFGEILLRRLQTRVERGLIKPASLVCITDSGFIPEAMPLVRYFGAENCILFRIHRDHHNYTGDSRGYIHIDDVPYYDIHNNSAPEDAINKVDEYLRKTILALPVLNDRPK